MSLTAEFLNTVKSFMKKNGKKSELPTACTSAPTCYIRPILAEAQTVDNSLSAKKGGENAY